MKKLLAVTLLLLLTGCASLPTRIDIKSGPELVESDQVDLSYYTPAGPIAGDSAQGIVSGFLAAGTGPQNDYAVAREFLTDSFAQRWSPDSGVIVRTGAPVFESAGNTLQIVKIGIAARIDEHGRYNDSELGEKTSLRFQLVLEGGEWRIASAPNLTVVTPPVFAVVFNAFPIYFLDASRSQLVPDLRWFPTRASTGTRLVNALLAGPSKWLGEAVTTAVPPATRLTIEAVNVQQGIALVDFDGTALEADPLERRLMLSQLRATLLQLSGVSDVAVSINNSAQEIIPADLQSTNPGGLVYFESENGIFQVNGTSSTPLSGTTNLLASEGAYDFAVEEGGESVAIATDQGVYLSQTTGLSNRSVLISDQTDLASLFFDSWGYLWLVPAAANKAIEVIGPDRSVRQFEDGATDQRISYSLSPEGIRLATLITGDAGPEVSVHGLLRDSRGWPVSTLGSLRVRNVLGEAIDVTWQQNSTLRVLERTTSGLTAVSDYPVTGPRSQLSMPPTAGTTLATGPSGLSTYLLSEVGEIWVLNGSAWRRLGTNATALSTDG
jgi:hypothetical protein